MCFTCCPLLTNSEEMDHASNQSPITKTLNPDQDPQQSDIAVDVGIQPGPNSWALDPGSAAVAQTQESAVDQDYNASIMDWNASVLDDQVSTLPKCNLL